MSKEAPAHYAAWLGYVKALAASPNLDTKTEVLVYLGFLAAARLEGNIPLHTSQATAHGAIREEVY
ncbi:carboxymuconolactone decarboxylase family protein [Agrobacterium rosae]|uniref:carboxymuconolactone decarboxylase family protein n=1 Tax=Agrobacterium rosae TaxID=1972867 RepID=UPI0020348A1B